MKRGVGLSFCFCMGNVL